MTDFYPPETYNELNDDISYVLYSEDTIARRVRELGEAISRDYAGLNPLLIGVLKGVMPFIADLQRMITIPLEIDFMAISSYSAKSRERGFVRLVKDLEEPLVGRHVLFIEHVIDTGMTLNYLLRSIKARNPASVKVCVLFDKSRRRLIDLPIDYKGFDFPDLFAVGYGLDFREKYRNLPYVGALKPEVLHPDDET